jgi:dynein regulatry complex protein 1
MMTRDYSICCRHFLTADMEKFHELWIMNEERCKEMTRKLLDADRVIFEQQLGLTWKPDDLSFMDNVGPIDMKKMPKPSLDVVRDILNDANEQTESMADDKKSSRLSNESMRKMLQLLCDEAVSDVVSRSIRLSPCARSLFER